MTATAQLLRNEFPQADKLAYLNHAAVSPWPQRTATAVSEFAKENVITGAQHYPNWLAKEAMLRKRLATLINAQSEEDIALLKSTSEALSIVAYGIDWKEGDNVVFAAEEFPSNRIVWESLASQGVEVRKVPISDCPDPESLLIQNMDKNTRLLSSSSVHYASGMSMNLAPLSEACKHHNAYFCVDAIQSIGAMPFDVQNINADFVMADGHKWMMGPEGLALFYCKPSVREDLVIRQFGWHMADMANYSSQQWHIKKSAQRFECGSPNMLGTIALESSLSLIEELGMEMISTKLKENVDYLAEQLSSIQGIEFHHHKNRPSGMINFTVDNHDSEALYRDLMSHDVICANRGKGVRLSPHFYTPKEKMDLAVSKIKSIIHSQLAG